MENKIKKVKLGSCCNIIMRQSKKFKTVGVSICYCLKYDYKAVTAFNILSKYFANCSKTYPSVELMNKHITNMYGSSLRVDYNYSGNCLDVIFSSSFVNKKYIKDADIFDKILQTLHDVIYNPLISENGLDPEIFSIFKDACIDDINAAKEYDTSYIIRQLKHAISEDKYSPFSTPYYGDEKYFKKLDEKNIVKYYKQLLHAPFDVYVTGDINFSESEKLVRKYFSKKGLHHYYKDIFDPIKFKDVGSKVINKPVSQAKVAVAYSMPVLYKDNDFYAARLLKLILSGTLSSKFGKVIREQMGLCYNISAAYFPYSGCLIVTTGVSSENVSKVIEEIENQIEEVRKGNVSDEEFNNARETMLNSFYAIDDSLYSILNLIRAYNSFDKEFVFEDEVIKYKNVTLKDAIEASLKLKYMGSVILDRG